MMIDYVIGVFREAYYFFNPEYAANFRLANLNGLNASGRLDKMVTSEVEALFRVRGEFPDNESV